MNKISSRDIRLFVAGALALAGFQALILIPSYFIVSRGSVLIGSALITGLALPIGIGIFFGKWSAFFWAQVYLWLKLLLGFTLIPFASHFYHGKIGPLVLRSAPEIVVAGILLALIFWSTSEKFRYESDI
jgi:hypothetical protein